VTCGKNDIRPERPDTQATAQQQHDELRDNGDGEAEERQNDEGMANFESTVVRSETGSDFQNKDAAIAALSVQRRRVR